MARSARTLARFCCKSGEGADEAAGWPGWAGWLGAATPCWTLFWLRISKARFLIITSAWAKALPATRMVAPIKARSVFIIFAAAISKLQGPGGFVNLARDPAFGGTQVLPPEPVVRRPVNGQPLP